MREHPLDEWERLKDQPLPKEYDSGVTRFGDRFRFTRCSATFTYGFNDSEIKFTKNRSGVKVHFAEFLDVDEIKRSKGLGEHLGWLQTTMTNEEAHMFGQWLMEPNTWGQK